MTIEDKIRELCTKWNKQVEATGVADRRFKEMYLEFEQNKRYIREQEWLYSWGS